ncbi:hypothetical protein [Lacisediminihabitans sp.]|jgi:hypothetical protein|uniref:hypothetical protein n=1 Tax=Lacisediminihabitans sp. TaxID=2787631 RepID=UPI002F91F172
MPSEPTPDSTPTAETSAPPPATEESVAAAQTSAAPPPADVETNSVPPSAAQSAPVAGNPPAQASRPRRGLVIAGAIVGAVVVLGATFGGGALVGSATHFDGPSMRQADRTHGNGPRGDRPDHGFMGPRGGQQGSNGRSNPGN